jgi:HNH endonuclease
MKKHKPHKRHHYTRAYELREVQLKNRTRHRLDYLLPLAAQAFDYCPISGKFTRKGTDIEAGFICDHGYVRITFKAKQIRSHRLAIFIMRGRPPEGDVDHVSGDRSDNRWTNIRECTRRLNLGNARLRNDNTSGFKGVEFIKERISRPWRARIRVHGVRKSLGYFETAESAHAAYMKAAHETFGEYARAA